MKNQDRQEILSQLQDAFFSEDKQDDRMTTEVLRIDNRNVARMTSIKERPTEDQLYTKYPNAVVVKEMITILNGYSERSIKEAGKKLQSKLVEASEDADTIYKLIDLCRDYQSKYLSTLDTIKKQMVLYCFISDFGKM